MPATLAAMVVLALSAAVEPAQADVGVRGGAAISGLLSSDRDFRPYLGYEVDLLQRVGYPQYGPQLSISWNTQLLDFLSVRPEFGFVQRGYHLNQVRLYNSSYKIRISYLELPVMLRVGLPHGRVRPGIATGPYVAYRLAAVGRLMDRGETVTRAIPTVRSLDYGVVLGLDTEVVTPGGRLLFDLRLNWGLADIMRETDGVIPLHHTPGRVQILSLGLSTGYGF